MRSTRLAQRIRVAEQKARRHDLARRLRDALANQEPPEALQEPVESSTGVPSSLRWREQHSTTTTMYREMDMRFWLEQAEAEMREL
jgi:hypothetical protein